MVIVLATSISRVFSLHNLYRCALRAGLQKCAWQAVTAGEDTAHLAFGPQEVLSVVDGEANMVQPFTILGQEVGQRSWTQWLDDLKAPLTGAGRGISGREP